MLKRLLVFSFNAGLAFAPAPKLPEKLQSQWVLFQQALEKNDFKALTALTQFPLRSNEFGGDMRTPKAFRQHYKTIFSTETKKCLQASALVPAEGARESYEVFCDAGGYPIRFIFKKVGSTYLFTAIDNINE